MPFRNKVCEGLINAVINTVAFAKGLCKSSLHIATNLPTQLTFSYTKSTKKHTRKKCEICSKLKLKTERRHWNIFHIFFWCFFRWLGTSKRLQGYFLPFEVLKLFCCQHWLLPAGLCSLCVSVFFGGLYFQIISLLSAILQNGQTHSNNSSAWRIVWVCLTILWNWCFKG